MNWKDIGGFVSNIAPTIGSILGGPAGEKAGELVSSLLGTPNNPDDVMNALKNNPDAIIKLKEIESNKALQLAQIALEDVKEDTARLSQINQTMQAEAANSDKEAWYQKAWRPVCGFAVAIGSLLSIAFIFFLFWSALTSTNAAVKVSEVISVIPGLASALALILGIPGAAVGISAWHRGMLQREQAKNS